MESKGVPEKTCQWWLWNHEANTWYADCGNYLTLPRHTPKWHGIEQCPSCGGNVTEVEPREWGQQSKN